MNYSIGEVANISGIPIPTLRYYDKINLLKPEYIEESNNYRYYSDENVLELVWIKQLRKLDVPPKRIREILAGGNVLQLRQELQNQLLELKEAQRDLMLKCDAVKKMQELLLESDEQNKVDTIYEKYYKVRNVISIKKEGSCEAPSYTKWYAELLKIAEDYGLHITGELSIKYFSRLYELDRSNAQIEISATVINNKSKCPFFHKERAFYGVAKIYRGSYNDIKEGYSGMLEYLQERHYDTPNYFMFRYLVNRAFTKEQNEYLTEIILPIEKMS